MICKYFFKGKEFQTEEELNDFLLDTETLKKTLGDVVYSITSRQRHYMEVLNKLSEEYKKLKDQKILIRSIEEAEEVEPEDLDDIGYVQLPYISVTDMIHTMPGRYTEQAFPIFRSDEYWKELFGKYRMGVFDKYELLFIGDLLKKDPEGNYERVVDDETLNKIRDRIEGALKNGVRRGGLWKLQALCGNFVHAIFAEFYRGYIKYKDSNGKEHKKYLYQSSQNEVVNYFKNSLGPEYRDFIKDELIESIVKLCYQLDKELRDEETGYGKNAFIRTELAIVGNISFLFDEHNKASNIIGKIDLLVIGDENHLNKVGIIDFKCSPKNYTTSNVDNDPMYYNSAKILTFKYQLAVYREILKQLGMGRDKDATNIDLFIVPLKFEDFKMENGKVSFSGISSLGDEEHNTMLQKLTSSDPGNERSNIESTLNLVFPREEYIRTSLETSDVIKTTKGVMDEWFPIKEKDTSLEGVKQYIEDNGGVQYNDQTSKYYFKPNRSNDNGMIIKEASSKEEAVIKIVEEIRKRNEYNQNFPINTANSMREAFIGYYKGEQENPIGLLQRNFSSLSTSSKRNASYIKSLLEKYTNTDVWKPVPADKGDPINAILDLFGLLLFENKNTHLIDVVRVSGLYDPNKKVHLPKGGYILGAYLTDQQAFNSAESLTMTSIKGNIELMETMIVLNQMAGLFSDDFSGIGKVLLFCPSLQTGLEVPNELLLYNFNRLCLLNKTLLKNNFVVNSASEGVIKMATYLDILKLDFEELKGKSDKYGLNALDKEIKGAVSKFDWKNKTNEQIKDDLLKLDKKLTTNYPEVLENIKNKDDDSSPLYRLHKDILYAISELSGVHMVLQVEDSKKYDFNLAGSNIGLGGTMIDNPGTLLSAILNQATNLITIAYQNTRDAVLEFDMKLREKVKKLKRKKGFNWISQNITGNQVKDLYYNMFDHMSSDVKFVNPWDPSVQANLDLEEIEFLKFAIIKINATRENDLNLLALSDNPDLMGLLIASNDKYLRVPLIKGDFASEVAIRGGISNLIRDRFKYLNIFSSDTRKLIKERMDAAATKLVSKDLSTTIYKGDLWEAINTMDDLDKNDDMREKRLNKFGKEYFEHNVETLLLKQHSAYTMAEELNKVFPIVLSLLIHLNSLGAVLNENFVNGIQYLLDYIKTKVHNQPMEDRDTQEATIRNILNKGMKWTSRFALAFNPRQMYLFLDGIWLDIKLFIKQPDGTLAFTKENLTWAWKFVMGDLFGNYGDNRSITELLNIKYGINDMDMNTYIDRIKSDSTGLFTHFWDTGFRFASRPDYYNRMTIFIAQMRADGSFEAHSIKNGRLTYDWTKDKRFKAFAENSPNKEEYNKAKAAYIALARLLVEEGARNEDGSLFVMDVLHPEKNPLPKAYSNRESESRKALSDRIYGYYAHEKKSMFNSTFVGSLVMQMNTYWSAKKNQWIQLKSYTQEGYYTDYEEDGQKYYWKINESTGQLEQTTEVTGLPVQVWKGRPLEGIAITAVNLYRAFKGDYEGLENAGLKGVKELLNGDDIDPDLRRLYWANLNLLWYDLFMLLVLGIFAGNLLESGLKSFAKNHPNDKPINAFANTAINLGVGIINSSADDFNFAKSIFGRGVLWTPFSFTSALNVFNQYKNVINGSLDLYDAIIKTSAATRGTTPLWECIKLNTVGRKIGQTASEVEKK